MIDIKNKIKLVIVVEAVVGGIRKHIMDLLENLNKNKYSITLIYSDLRADKIFLNNISNLSSSEISIIKIDMVREINPLIDAQSLFKIRKELKRISPDILHLHAAKAGTLGRLVAFTLGIKNVVYTPHGGSFHKFGDKFGFLYKSIEKILILKSVHFIAVSQFAWNQYDAILNVPQQRNHLIYNGIALKDESNSKIKNPYVKYGLNEENFIVLVPAMFYEAKGHLELLKNINDAGIKLNPSIQILFAGNGPLQSEIKDMINFYNLSHNVKFLGFIEEMEPFFKFANIVLLPSIHEIFGYVILEAMAYGKTVIANNVDAISELIENEVNGILIEPNKWIDISARLNYFVDHKEELEALGLKGKESIFTKFSLTTMIDKTDLLYSQFLV